jgi:hypothetical protein
MKPTVPFHCDCSELATIPCRGAYLFPVRPMRCSTAVVVLMSACFARAAYCERSPDDPAYLASLDADAWKQLIEQRVQAQRAGEKAPDKELTWQEY